MLQGPPGLVMQGKAGQAASGITTSSSESCERGIVPQGEREPAPVAGSSRPILENRAGCGILEPDDEEQVFDAVPAGVPNFSIGDDDSGSEVALEYFSIGDDDSGSEVALEYCADSGIHSMFASGCTQHEVTESAAQAGPLISENGLVGSRNPVAGSPLGDSGSGGTANSPDTLLGPHPGEEAIEALAGDIGVVEEDAFEGLGSAVSGSEVNEHHPEDGSNILDEVYVAVARLCCPSLVHGQNVVGHVGHVTEGSSFVVISSGNWVKVSDVVGAVASYISEANVQATISIWESLKVMLQSQQLVRFSVPFIYCQPLVHAFGKKESVATTNALQHLDASGSIEGEEEEPTSGYEKHR